MKIIALLFIFMFLIGNFVLTGCYNQPPGSEPQKPSSESSDKK